MIKNTRGKDEIAILVARVRIERTSTSLWGWRPAICLPRDVRRPKGKDGAGVCIDHEFKNELSRPRFHDR